MTAVLDRLSFPDLVANSYVTSRPCIAPELPRPPARMLTPGLLCLAASLVEEVGLYKKDLWPGACTDSPSAIAESERYRPGDPVCALGAVLVVCGWGSAPLQFSLDQMIVDRHNVLSGLVSFNDLPLSSARDVARWLLVAASRLEQAQRLPIAV